MHTSKIAVLIVGAMVIHVPAAMARPDLTGYKLVFDEEFNGTSVDWSKWSDESSSQSDGQHGNLPNKQLEWNHAANAMVADGHLTITAKRENFRSPSGKTYAWTSSLLTSSPSFAFQYGYIEERAMFPAKKGFWPSFWTWQLPGDNSPVS